MLKDATHPDESTFFFFVITGVYRIGDKTVVARDPMIVLLVNFFFCLTLVYVYCFCNVRLVFD